MDAGVGWGLLDTKGAAELMSLIFRGMESDAPAATTANPVVMHAR